MTLIIISSTIYALIMMLMMINSFVELEKRVVARGDVVVIVVTSLAWPIAVLVVLAAHVMRQRSGAAVARLPEIS